MESIFLGCYSVCVLSVLHYACPFIKKGKRARELTVKDGLELEGDRLCYILKKKTEESNTRYREEAETVKQLIFEMGKKAQKPVRGRPKRK